MLRLLVRQPSLTVSNVTPRLRALQAFNTASLLHTRTGHTSTSVVNSPLNGRSLVSPMCCATFFKPFSNTLQAGRRVEQSSHVRAHSLLLPSDLAAEGRATIVDANTVEVTYPNGGTRRLRTRNILVATGGIPSAVPIPGHVGISWTSCIECCAY